MRRLKSSFAPKNNPMNALDFKKSAIEKSKRVVIKIGSAVLTHHSEILDINLIESITSDISEIINSGREVIIVTSGAVAAGCRKLGLARIPRRIPEKQAAAAAGQSTLIRSYEKAFEKKGKKAAQLLLTSDGLSDRTRYLNARNTVFSLLQHGVIPVINENDSVAVDEMRFGDNDNLSAMVTGLSDSDLLIILTDIDGLYDKDPRKFSDAQLIHTVTDFDAQTRGASRTGSDVGTGGMITKIEAARKAASFGAPTVIANGGKKGILIDIVNAGDHGTTFLPGEDRLRGRKRWIAYNLKLNGKIIVDSGAMKAINNGKSLLPSGIIKVEGGFDFGDLVSLLEESGKEFARGLVQYKSDEIDAMKGIKTSEIESYLGKKDYDEVIHRDDLVLL